MIPISERRPPLFSPDGNKIAYDVVQIGAHRDIWLMDSDGKNAKPLGAAPNNALFQGWFPGGERLAFRSFQERP